MQITSTFFQLQRDHTFISKFPHHKEQVRGTKRNETSHYSRRSDKMSADNRVDINAHIHLSVGWTE